MVRQLLVSNISHIKFLMIFPNMKIFPVMRNYFCAKHGKAEADGAIGRMSLHIDSVVRSGTHEFSNAHDVYRYCQLNINEYIMMI